MYYDEPNLRIAIREERIEGFNNISYYWEIFNHKEVGLLYVGTGQMSLYRGYCCSKLTNQATPVSALSHKFLKCTQKPNYVPPMILWLWLGHHTHCALSASCQVYQTCSASARITSCCVATAMIDRGYSRAHLATPLHE